MHSNSSGRMPLPPLYPGAVQGGHPVFPGQNPYAPACDIRPAGTGNTTIVTPHGTVPVQAAGAPTMQGLMPPAFRDETSERLWGEYTNARASLFRPGLLPGMRFVMLMKVRGSSHALVNEAWAALRPGIARDLMAVALATDDKVAGELRPLLNADIPPYFEGFVPSGLEAMNERLQTRAFGGAVLQASLSRMAGPGPGPSPSPQPTPRQDLPAGENSAEQAGSPWQEIFGSDFEEVFKAQLNDEPDNGDSEDEFRPPAESSGHHSIDDGGGASPVPSRPPRSTATRARGRKTVIMNGFLLRLQQIRDKLSNDRSADHVAMAMLLKSRLAFSFEDRQKFAENAIDHFVDVLQAKHEGVAVDKDKQRENFIELLKKMCSFHKLNARALKLRRKEKGGEPSGKPAMDPSNVHLLRCLYANPALLHMLGKADKKTISQLRRSLGVYVKIEILERLDKGNLRLSKAQVDYIIETSFLIQAKAITMIEAARKACPQRGDVEAADTDGGDEPMESSDVASDYEVDADGDDDEY